jgi:hypothetical protein
MKASTTKPTAIPETSVFPQTLHRLRSDPEATNPKSKKRDNISPKSRDTREDRGAREMKTSHNPQSLFHICALLLF